MKKYCVMLASLFGIILFFYTPQNADAREGRGSSRYKQDLQVQVSPSFFPLAPCPTCSSPTNPPLSTAPVVSISTGSLPAVSVEPCDNSSIASDNHRPKGKHKKHRGAISGGMEELLKFLMELINKLIELLGGSPIQTPQTPQTPDVPDQPDNPDEPEAPDQPAVSQAPNAPDQPEEPETPNPCAPSTNPSSAPQPTQPASVPSSIISSAVPQPSGTGAAACVVSASAKEQDIDPSDSKEAFWPRAAGQEVVVNYATQGLPARYAAAVQTGATNWSKSPCLELKVAPTCPPNANCITVKTAPSAGDGDTDGEFSGNDSGNVRSGGTITLYTDLLDKASDQGLAATTVHEMGHSIGLVHRLNQNDLMNASTSDSTNPMPDDIDFQNLLFYYGTKQ